MEVSLEFLGDVTDKMLEGELADEKLIRFLVSSDLTESNSSWPVVAVTAKGASQMVSTIFLHTLSYTISWAQQSVWYTNSRQKGHSVVSQ